MTPITFTDEHGVEWTVALRARAPYEMTRDATPDDLARAGYVNADEYNALLHRSGFVTNDRELEALRALYDHVREYGHYDRWEELCETTEALLKAIDEARE